jgi:mannitol-1-phosphate 5-dehydrogenase
MVNPYVRDTVARVGRDPARKLAWDDRLIGAMRLAMHAGITPRRYAVGVAAALRWLEIAPERTEAYLSALWQPSAPAQAEAQRILEQIMLACSQLETWTRQNHPDLV